MLHWNILVRDRGNEIQKQWVGRGKASTLQSAINTTLEMANSIKIKDKLRWILGITDY